jgi:endonuclease YncB( thermonuclease family)
MLECFPKGSVKMHRLRTVMFRLRDVAIAGTALLVCAGLWSQPACHALDGQTLRCGRERVSVQGVHAPAIDLPGGKEAKRRLEQRIGSGKVLIFRLERDMYGQTVGMVYVDGARIRQTDIHLAEVGFLPLVIDRVVYLQPGVDE